MILENVVTFDGMGSLTSTFVAISLPLSSMWAAACTTHQSSAAASNADFYDDGYKTFNTNTNTTVTTTAASFSKRQNTRDLAVNVEKSFDVASSSADASPTKTECEEDENELKYRGSGGFVSPC